MPTKVMKKVVIEWRVTYPEPLVVKIGETVTVGKKDTEWPFAWCTDSDGKSGWLPLKCLSDQPGTASCLYDYSTAELSVSLGEEVTIEKEDSGWVWATNCAGISGWIPARCIKDAEQ